MSEKIFKHTPYYEVLEFLQKAKTCPLCEMRERSNRRYFDSLLYENVNDPALRKHLMESGGFCARHAGIMLEFGDGLGIAILYQDQLKQTLEFLNGGEFLRPSALTKKIASLFKSRKECPACMNEHENDEYRLQTLLNGLSESEMRDAFGLSPGLCLPHLIKALLKNKDAAIQEYIIKFHQIKYSDLLAELQEFCKKHDYHRADEKFGKESDSWRRAVLLLAPEKDTHFSG